MSLPATDHGNADQPRADGGAPSDVERRRTFAIISHPDAGKTTLTEKLLLHAGALSEAGSVRARRRARSTVSDWMEIERRRGISISSTVLRFEWHDWLFNLVDAPGHADFSEDTYRTLWAVDAALMVVDGTRGLERQTLKLFEVCRRRQLPIVTFINKCDRPGIEPLALLDEIEQRIGMPAAPVSWPVGTDGQLDAIVDVRRRIVVQTEATAHGATVGERREAPAQEWRPPAGREAAWAEAREEMELLEADAAAPEVLEVHAGRVTPVFFGSALANQGVEMLLDGLTRYMPPPYPKALADGRPPAIDGPFSGQVFKVQANLDPRHRDRIAFLRVHTGTFERGMSVFNSRTGRRLSLAHAHEMFGQERETISQASPGDVVGVVNASGVLLGDTLTEEPTLRYPPIPAFLPEHFAYLRNLDGKNYKRFQTAMQQLDEEGVIRLLEPVSVDGERVVGVVGPLQLEVAAERMATEFACPIRIDTVAYELARWIEPSAVPLVPTRRGVLVVRDSADRHLALFASRFAMERAEQDQPALRLLIEPPAG
ncbi:MAG TPA: peptide chain release factor 3 [Candidatus Limnocylindrales bacterium]|jgi:peptide chain release factor 3|nr:peptide chain release factor 3 [Candidatus Limnocylindrales bacterium]